MSAYDDIAEKLGLPAPTKSAGTTYDSIFAAINPGNRAQSKPKAEPVTDFSGNLRLGPYDTGIPLPEAVNKRLAQLGSGFADAILAAKQITGNAPAEDALAKRARDAALNEDFTGKALNFGAKLAPLIAMPNVGGPVVGGMLAGGVGGALEPTAPGESRVGNMALSSVLGGALPMVAKGVSRYFKPDDATQAAAELAKKYGMPVTPADLSPNGLVQGFRAATNDIPIVGMAGQSVNQAKQTALNRATGETFGASADRLTPDVVAPAVKRMSSEFDRIWGSNTMAIDAPMFTKMQQLRASAADLPLEEGRRVAGMIDDLWSKAKPDANGIPTIQGDAANKFQQWLREKAAGQSLFAKDAAELRRTILDAFNRSNPNDALALNLNRAQWKAYKTVAPLLDKGAVGTAGRAEGNIPAALLPEAVRQSYQGLSTQVKQPALAEIAQVGSRFAVDRTPQTGGSPRALAQNLGIAAMIPAGGMGLGLDPLITGGATLGGMTALNALLNNSALGAKIAAGKTLTRTESNWLKALMESAARGASRAPATQGARMFNTPPEE